MTDGKIIYDSMPVEIRYDGFSCGVNTAVNKKTAVLCEINNTTHNNNVPKSASLSAPATGFHL